jgi:1-piperideine-2-carboxylate/1-pyrroline-2-carboxylate reductase [NAD(P)H]
MSASTIKVFNAEQTARILNFPELVAAISTASLQYANHAITAPARQVVPLAQGGVLLSMPAAASDIAIHKLVTIVPDNRGLGLPTIHGIVAAYDGKTGRELCILDGPTVTARRTAAVSLLGLQTFLPAAPRRIALIGTGKQAAGHVEAIAALFPGIHLFCVGSSAAKAALFAAAHAHWPLHLSAAATVPDDIDAAIMATTSKTPVYHSPAQTGRLVIGVGAFEADSAEIAADIVLSSQVYVDDLASAHHEAGDLILAHADWDKVRPLSHALANGVDHGRPIVFKTVGCAAWDLAAARCALNYLE